MIRGSEIQLLQTLFTFEQEQLHDFLYEFLLDFYTEDEIIEDDTHYLYVKGSIPVLLVAHLDTVHKQKPTEDEIFYDPKKHRMWSPLGIGADDRCGIFAIMLLIMRGYRPHIAFTWNEEVGGLGARKMIIDFLPKDINFAIQIDRKGSQEAVYYYLDNLDFENYINSFGFKTQIGTYTDICEICPEWNFAGVNLSAGYLYEHTTSEIVMLDVLLDTVNKVEKILDDQNTSPQFFEYKEVQKFYTHAVGMDISDSEYYGYESSYYSQHDYCMGCGGKTPWYKFSTKPELADLCLDCAENLFPTKQVVRSLNNHVKHGNKI